ncbi:uncharacterized protein [Channa argus]|uniref:uncharacterized protein isoform X2 n=1 Tax=Channa argus TaxID=215402 RepID=UPI003522AB20
MAELTSLFLILTLQFTATNGKMFYFTVRAGDKVTLPCENLTVDQDPCDGTTWSFQKSKTTVKLFENGTIQEEAKVKSDRLSVTVNCAVVIKRVTVDDAGLYVCQQSGPQQGEESVVYLFVVSMTEEKNSENVTLTCSVSTFVWCNPTVEWLFEGNGTDFKDMKTSQGSCSDTVTLTTHLSQESKIRKLLKCSVKDSYSGAVHHFTFINQSSDSPLVLRCIIVSVGLAALIVSVVTVNVWTRTKGNKTQMEQNTEFKN